MKLTHQAAEQLVKAIIDRVNRIYESNYTCLISVNPEIITIGIFYYPRWNPKVSRPLITKEDLKFYETKIKENIPIYTNELELIDSCIGLFEGYRYYPEDKSYRRAYRIIDGAGIIEIKVKEGLHIED